MIKLKKAKNKKRLYMPPIQMKIFKWRDRYGRDRYALKFLDDYYDFEYGRYGRFVEYPCWYEKDQFFKYLEEEFKLKVTRKCLMKFV